MHFVGFNDIDPQEWDNFVLSSPDGWIFSLHCWQELIKAVRRWALAECSFAIKDGDRFLTIVPLQYSDADRTLSSSGFGSSGPIFAPFLEGVELEQVTEATYRKISEIAASKGAERIWVTISPLTKRSLQTRSGVNPLVMKGFRDFSTQTMIVDLARREEELWSDLSQLSRRKIRKAREQGYEVVRLKWPDAVDRYYEMHVETYNRTGAVPHPFEYFDGIARGPGAKGFSVLFGVQSKDGRIVAFHNSARMPHASLYHTGCSAVESLDSGANYLLFWEALIAARADGCSWYEVGEIFPQAKGDKSAGLTQLKTKFGGEQHQYFKGELSSFASLSSGGDGELVAQWDAVLR